MQQNEDEYEYGSSDFENDFEEDSEEDLEEDLDDVEEQDSLQASTTEDRAFIQEGRIEVVSSIHYETSNNIQPPDDESDDISYTDPEVFLTKLLNRNIDGDFDKARTNRIRCLALCKIIYGEAHWKVAEAHVQLANVYLKGKHYPLQIQKHTTIARDILLSATKMDTFGESNKQYLLQNLYYLMGRANFQLGRYKISENHLMKAKLVADHSKNSMTKFLTMKINILSSLASTLTKLGQVGQAIEYIEEGIEITGKMSGSDKYMAINLHKQIVSVELGNGNDANISFAMQSALTAHLLSVTSNGSDSSATAEIYLLIARVEILKDIPDYKSIEGNLQKALKIYTRLENNAKIIRTQEMISKVYMKQEKFAAAKSILKQAITTTEDKFGDMSLQSAELYELMGNILFSERKLSNALTYFLKAEETFKGKTRYQSRQMKIKKVIGVIMKSNQDKIKSSEMKMKERPRFN